MQLFFEHFVQLAAVVDFILSLIIFIGEYVCLAAEVLHELQFDLSGVDQTL